MYAIHISISRICPFPFKIDKTFSYAGYAYEKPVCETLVYFRLDIIIVLSEIGLDPRPYIYDDFK